MVQSTVNMISLIPRIQVDKVQESKYFLSIFDNELELGTDPTFAFSFYSTVSIPYL